MFSPLLVPSFPLLDGGDPINVGLVGGWGLADGGGSNARDYAKGNTGALQAFAVSEWATGQPGNVLTLNGSTQYVNVPFINAYNSNNFTLSIWFRTTMSGTGTFMRRDAATRNWLFRINSGQVQSILIYGSIPSVTSAGTYNDGKWHHALTTWAYDGTNTTLRLYVDGVDQGSATQAGTVPAGSDVVTFGNWLAGSSEFFSGSLSNARMWNRALLHTEIRLLYLRPNAGLRSLLYPLVAFSSGGGATRGLFQASSLNGLGAGGSFFHDRLAA